MPTIKLFFLGLPQITLNEQPVPLKSAKAMALLAYLALRRLPQTRDHVTDLFWPDSLPDAARKNLRNTLWAIRKALGDDLLAANADRMALSDGVWCDVHAFESAAESTDTAATAAAVQSALNLYRAPLLDGLTVSDAPDFELWLSTERERLGRLYLRLLENQMAGQRAAVRWNEVISTARRALAADNLQEPIHRALMEAHARLGERAEALRQYDILRTTLARELGVAPLPETEQLRAAVTDGSLEQMAQSAPASPLPRPPRPARPTPPARPFVGRQSELAALDAALQQAGSGQAQAILLTGELGIGKSRLWQVWSMNLPNDVTVLETRCLDTTQALPFAPLVTLFGQSTCIEALFSPDSPVSNIWLAELVRLLPEIRRRAPELPTPPALPPEEEHRRLFEAFTQVVHALLDHPPLVLFVDDLHWADQSTLDWLVYLLERLRQSPLLLVGAYRPSDAAPQLGRVVASWGRDGLARRLPLNRLSESEAAELIAAIGRKPTETEILHLQSAGNPYFLIELSQSDSDSPPTVLAELIRARLERLPETARQVLQAAAVLDVNFDFATLRRTSGRDEEETLNGLDALLDDAVLAEQGSGYTFTHPLVATVVRNDLSLARRSFLHRRAAQSLEALYPNRLESIAGQLANHYNAAGRPAQAAHFAEVAGAEALKLTAPTEAVNFYRQALRMEPTPGRHLGLGRAIFAQGDLATARESYRQAAAAFEAADDRRGAARAYIELALSFMPSGQGGEVVRWAEQALTCLGNQTDVAVQAQAHQLLAAGGMLAGGSLDEAEAQLQRSVHLAIDHNLPQLAGIARFELGNLLAQRGKLAQALESFEAAINFARAGNNLFELALGHNNLAYHALLAGDVRRARENIDIGLALAEQHSLFVPRQYLYSTRGEIALAEGEFEAAARWFEQALTEANNNHNESFAANIQANQGRLAQARGDTDEALLLLEAARTAAADVSAVHLQTQVDLWLTELHLQRGEKTAARESLAHAEQRLAGGQREGLQNWAARLRAELG